MTHNTSFQEPFFEDLLRQEAAAKTVASYRLDLSHFFRWFEGTLREAPTPEAATPTDIRDYRAHLVTIEKRRPATVNRRLAALRRFFQWAKATSSTPNNRGQAAWGHHLGRRPRRLGATPGTG
jgi:site-specific recombinase XerD